MSAINNRYDFMVIFEARNSNPNGDPDASNMPRTDIETGRGIVTDVCLKRKIRNYIDIVMDKKDGFDIYTRGDVPLVKNDKKAYVAAGIEDVENDKKRQDSAKKDPDIEKKIFDYMNKTFFDIRAFGAVMTTPVKDKLGCGQVRGPIQLGFAESVDPIIPQEICITRSAITTEKDAADKQTEMGRKYVVPYGLYVVRGHIDATLAQKVTGFSEDDLELFWNAILNMFELDRSAARGDMSVRKLIIFKHDSLYGNAPAYKLFESVKIKKKDGVEFPRSFSDYTVEIPEVVPSGVILEVRE